MNLVSLREVSKNELYPFLIPFGVCDLVDEKIAGMLLEANQLFNKYGYRLVIYSAYRTEKEQEECYHDMMLRLFNESRSWDKAKEGAGKLVLSVDKSLHCRGLAVDTGLVLLMSGDPIDLHERLLPFAEESRFDCSKVSLNNRYLRAILRLTMERVGFSSIEEEFWHFELRIK